MDLAFYYAYSFREYYNKTIILLNTIYFQGKQDNFFFNYLFSIGVWLINTMIVSGDQQRYSAKITCNMLKCLKEFLV